MKRISYWVLSTVSAVVLLFGYHTSTSGPLATGTSTKTFSAGTSGTTAAGAGAGAGGNGNSTSTGSRKATTAKKKATVSTSRTVTGQVIQTQWGPVQVQLRISGSRIAGVTVLQYPNGSGTDQQINSYALPILTQETMNAQSANIDMVSGATYTSDGYVQSLQSALDQAGI